LLPFKKPLAGKFVQGECPTVVPAKKTAIFWWRRDVIYEILLVVFRDVPTGGTFPKIWQSPERRWSFV
jgi:hypothetical protein